MKSSRFVKFIFIVLLAIILGGVMGEFIRVVLPECLLKDALINSIFKISAGMGEAVRDSSGEVIKHVDRDPMILDLGFLRMKFGILWRFNFVSFLGILLAVYLFKIYRH